MCGSSRPQMFCKKGVLRNFGKFTWKYLYHNFFFNEVADLHLQLYWERDSGTGIFM